MRPSAITSVLATAGWLSAGALSGACKSSPASSNGDDAAADAPSEGSAEASLDASAEASTEGDDAGLYPFPVVAGVRLAVWSTQPLPAVDFCLAPHGTTAFLGPMLYQEVAALGGLPDSGDDDAGIVAGLVYPQVSSYASVPPGQYDLRVVAAGSPNCPAGVLPDVTNLPALPRDGTLTVALLDKTAGGSGFTMTSFVDDVSSSIPSVFIEAGSPEGGEGGEAGDEDAGADPDASEAGDAGPGIPATTPGRILVRFLNADPGEPSADLQVHLPAYSSYVNLFRAVGYGQRSSVANAPNVYQGVDDAGYLNLPPNAADYYALRTQGQGLLGQASVVEPPGVVMTLVLLPATSLATLATQGASDAGDAAPSPSGPPTAQLLVCFDNSAGPGDLSACQFGQ